MSITKTGSWIFPDAQQFVANFFLSQHVDEPLELLQRRAFTEVCGKLLRYSGCTNALHVFCNAIGTTKHACERLEFDALHVDARNVEYIKKATRLRHHSSEEKDSVQGLPLYENVSKLGAEATGLFLNLRSILADCHPCHPAHAAIDKWQTFLDGVRGKFPELACAGKHIIVVPLSLMSEKYPCGSLGLVLLWDNDGSSDTVSEEDQIVREERLRPVIKLISASLKRFLTLHYQVSEETYLPQYKRSGKRSVAIMFADIRNFTSTTEVFRNFNLLDVWLAFMHDFCREMGAAVNQHRGRVQSFSGDGIMCLFGEYMAAEGEAAECALKAAKAMCVRFKQLKSEFLQKNVIQTFLGRECDPVDFDLGVGLNYGLVIFDYFGPENRRVFAPLGDHVNFAQRLESNAGKFDPQLGRHRAPILMSRPFWSVLGKPQGYNSIPLDLKGKSWYYEGFECFLSDDKKNSEPSGCAV